MIVKHIGGKRVECVEGDITKQPGFDAVVNAANAELVPGGGVAGAIHRAAGPELAEACRALAPIRPGEAVITPAFRLPNRFVIHCLGPVFGRDEPAAELLASCYVNALKRAEEHRLHSIAFPAISTGAFGYPLPEAAEVAVQAVLFTLPKLRHVGLVRFCLFGQEAYRVFAGALATHACSSAGGWQPEE
ncbi:MAG: macro domain-containing protein [Limnochordales bacterium]|nr:macro domain-containing protein [Limnochordales bacterium]